MHRGSRRSEERKRHIRKAYKQEASAFQNELNNDFEPLKLNSSIDVDEEKEVYERSVFEADGNQQKKTKRSKHLKQEWLPEEVKQWRKVQADFEKRQKNPDMVNKHNMYQWWVKYSLLCEIINFQNNISVFTYESFVTK